MLIGVRKVNVDMPPLSWGQTCAFKFSKVLSYKVLIKRAFILNCLKSPCFAELLFIHWPLPQNGDLGRWSLGTAIHFFNTDEKRVLISCFLNEGSLFIKMSFFSSKGNASFFLQSSAGVTKISGFHLPSPLHPFNIQNFLNPFPVAVTHSFVVSLIFHNQQCLGLMISLESLFFILISSFCPALTWPAVDLKESTLICDPVERKRWSVTAI